MGGSKHVVGTHNWFVHVGSVMRVEKVAGLQVVGFQVGGIEYWGTR